MGVCSNCGAAIDDTAKFCVKCGTPHEIIENTAGPIPAFSCEEVVPQSTDMYIRPVDQPEQSASAEQTKAMNDSESAQNATNPMKKFPVWIPVLIGSLALVLGIVITGMVHVYNRLYGCVDVDLNSCVTTQIAGPDQHAECVVTVNTDRLANKMYDALQKSNSNYERIADSVEFVIKDSSGRAVTGNYLANGDVIVVHADWNKTLAKEARIKLVWEDIYITVSDLETNIPLNPFEYVDLVYSGVSGFGSVYYVVKDGTPSAISNLIYDTYFDKSNKLCNGDDITLSFDDSQWATDYARENGYDLTVLSYTYTVSGLDVELYYADQFNSDVVALLKKIAKEAIDEEYYDATVDDLTYHGFYLGSHDGYNDIVIMYTANMTSDYGYFNATEVYIPVYIYDATFNYFKTQIHYHGPEILGYSYIGNSSWAVAGYTDLATFWNSYGEDYYLEWNGDDYIGEQMAELAASQGVPTDGGYYAYLILETDDLCSYTAAGDPNLITYLSDSYYCEVIMDGSTYNYVGALNIHGALGDYGTVTVLGIATTIPASEAPEVLYEAYLFMDDTMDSYDITEDIGYLDVNGYRYFYLINEFYNHNVGYLEGVEMPQDSIVISFTIR